MDKLSEANREPSVQVTPVQSNGRYNRKRAVIYANKYAGSAWGAGNRNQYNDRYRDYTDEGGDCTNFASQVIGDPIEGGGLQMLPNWHFSPQSGGTVSWIRTDSFKDFLLYGGYGQLIASGYFEDVTKPTPSFPKGAIHELKPGDLIGYEMKGDLDHFSIVVGTDDHGYLLVNSYTWDRYRMPWDIGWDNKTKFWLIQIKD
ncbi:amidase domain-containing protein [Ammoniphilus sp. 3BR4]|uniref:amidase domain-containing protein n=1 Tax=Ammoniphilus sp. 3BR4 TaxID=3158265 RepID=UPI00346652B8